MQLLQRIESAAPAAEDAPPAGGSGLAVRRELLEQALQKLQALKSENERLWAMLEDLLAGSGGSQGGGGGRRNQYVAHLEAERAELAGQLAAARREHGEAAARLAAAQAALGKLQGAAQRLSHSAGGRPADAVPPLGLPAPLQRAAPAASPAGQQPQPSGVSSSASDVESWQAEKRLLKAICKLALAVTMDQVGGRQEAASLADELAPTMAAHSAMLRTLGLHKVWASLHKLALAGGSARGASQTTPRPQAEASPAAAATGWVPPDVAALQQRVHHYQARGSCFVRQQRGVAVRRAAGGPPLCALPPCMLSSAGNPSLQQR